MKRTDDLSIGIGKADRPARRRGKPVAEHEPLRCEHCGCNIPDGEEIQETTTSSGGTAPGGLTTYGESFYLCKSCAHRKSRFWNILIILFLVVPVAICLLSSIPSFFRR